MNLVRGGKEAPMNWRSASQKIIIIIILKKNKKYKALDQLYVQDKRMNECHFIREEFVMIPGCNHGEASSSGSRTRRIDHMTASTPSSTIWRIALYIV
jgi:hypothetical protein